MNQNTIRVLFAATALGLCLLSFTGCHKEKYTIDTPYDFSSIASKAPSATEESGGNKEPSGSSEAGTPSATAQGSSENTGNLATFQASAVPGNSSSSEGAANSGSQNGTDKGSSSVGNTNGADFLEEAENYKIPQDTTEKMTTEALMQTYMSYPLLDTLCFEESPEEVYRTWIQSEASCGQELMSRKEAVSVALAYYQEAVESEPTQHVSTEADFTSELKLDWIELLLYQDTMKKQANTQQKSEIVRLAEQRDQTLESNGYAIADQLPDLAAAYR